MSDRDDRIGFAWPRHSLLQNPFATGSGGAGSTTANNVKAAGLLPHLTAVAIHLKDGTWNIKKKKIMLSLNKHTNSTKRFIMVSGTKSFFFLMRLCKRLSGCSHLLGVLAHQYVTYKMWGILISIILGGIVHKYSQILVAETAVSMVFGSRFCGNLRRTIESGILAWKDGFGNWLQLLGLFGYSYGHWISPTCWCEKTLWMCRGLCSMAKQMR